MTVEPESWRWDGPPLSAWEAWTPGEAARELAGVGCEWYVIGGWAIDLFLGERTREHEDLEIAILREDFPAMRDHLARYRLHAVGDGEVRRLEAGEMPPHDKRQNWVLDLDHDKWRMDVMLEPGTREIWACRRDETLSVPRSTIIDDSGPIAFLAPQAVLLFKAKHCRAKDEQDLHACLPHMDAAARDWLRRALEKVHPGHAWLNDV